MIMINQYQIIYANFQVFFISFSYTSSTIDITSKIVKYELKYIIEIILQAELISSE